MSDDYKDYIEGAHGLGSGNKKAGIAGYRLDVEVSSTYLALPSRRAAASRSSLATISEAFAL